MHVAILLAGHTNKAMPRRFHDYHDMFTILFQGLPNVAGFRFTTLAVVDDIFPSHLDDYDGYLISGSAYGVYDDAPFIARLIDLIQRIHQAKKPLLAFVLAIKLSPMHLVVRLRNGMMVGFLAQ